MFVNIRQALVCVLVASLFPAFAHAARPNHQRNQTQPSSLSTKFRQGLKSAVANTQTNTNTSKFNRLAFPTRTFPNGNSGISGLGLPQTPPPSRINTKPPQPHVRLDRAALRQSLAQKANGAQGLIANRNGQVNPKRMTFGIGDVLGVPGDVVKGAGSAVGDIGSGIGDVFSHVGPGKSAPPIDPPTGKTTSGPLKVDPAPAPAPISDKPRYKEVGKLGVKHTQPDTTTPQPTTPPPVTTTPPPTDMGNGNGGHHHHGDWIPAVVGAIVQARMNSGYNGYPVYTQPVYQAPVYAAPQYAAPVQYVPAPVVNALAIYAVEPLQGAPGQLLIRGEGFGTQPGQIVLDANGVRLGMETVSWIPNAVVVKFPNVQIAPGAPVTFTAVRVDGVASQAFNPAAPNAVATR